MVEFDEIKLLRGKPVEIQYGIKVYPLTLDEISEIGSKIYNSRIGTFFVDKSLLNEANDIPIETLEEIHKLNDLEFIYYLALSGDINLIYSLSDALRMVLKCDVVVEQNADIKIFKGEEIVTLDNDLFLSIKKIITKQNFLKDDEKTEFRPANAKARALLEKLNKAKENLQTQNKKDGLSLNDIISIVATHSNDINIITVWNLTVYQLYICYLRLLMWDDYHNKYQLIPHSSDIDALDLKHWAVDINKIK